MPEQGCAVAAAEDGAREVVLLLVDPEARARRRASLQRARFSPVVPRPLLAWAAGRGSDVLLVVDDDARTGRVVEAVRRAAPGAGCVVLAREPTPSRYRELLASGMTVLPASTDDEELALAVRLTGRALACLPAAAARSLVRPEDDAAPDLAARERGWLCALAGGATVAGVARSAGLSQREMYRQLALTYGRLGATTRTEALLRADRLGLLAEAVRPG